MSLEGWQSTLSNMVIATSARTSLALESADAQLSDGERKWLTRLEATAGFKVTCEVQRWWREFRVQSAAPLTLGLLGPGQREDMVATFVRRNPKPSSFFIREALPFLDLVRDSAPGAPHLVEVAAFERAMLVLGHALSSGIVVNPGAFVPGRLVEVHPLAEVVRFSSRPEKVLAAATRGLTLPSVEAQPYWLLVAPLLPNLARTCSREEAALFQGLRERPLPPRAEPALISLWQAGALRHPG